MNKFIFGLGWVYNKNTLDLVHVSSHPNPILWHVRAMCAQDAMPTGGNLPIKGGWEGGGVKRAALLLWQYENQLVRMEGTAGSSFKGRPSHPIKVKVSGRMNNWHRCYVPIGLSFFFFTRTQQKGEAEAKVAMRQTL